jgi:hypothetical protein
MRRLSKILCLIGFVSALGGCASSRSTWVPLTPSGPYSQTDVLQAEKTLHNVTVSAQLLQGKSRYLAKIEVISHWKQKDVHGPEDVVLQDGTGAVQPALSADDLKDEIRRNAEYQADYSLNSWPRYYYAPRRVYYGRRGYRYAYVGPYFHPYFHDDWFERRMDAERILSQANRTISSLDAEYLRSQDIPPGGTVEGFVQFAKKSAAGPLKLSLKVENQSYVFEFLP